MSAINNIANAIPTAQELETIREANLVRKYVKNQADIDKFINWVSSKMRDDSKNRHFLFDMSNFGELEDIVEKNWDVLEFLFNKRGWYLKFEFDSYHFLTIEIECL